MMLRLSIENVDRLPDGGPLRIEVKGRGLDFGRDAHLDWTLPDPGRTVSSKHCEVRFRDGGYWLHDVSTNGTFVNGSPYRLDAPYLLRDGDLLNIGPYIIAVSVEGQQGAARGSASAPAPAASDVWETAEEAAAPDDRAAYKIQKPAGAVRRLSRFRGAGRARESSGSARGGAAPARRMARRNAGAGAAGGDRGPRHTLASPPGPAASSTRAYPRRTSGGC